MQDCGRVQLYEYYETGNWYDSKGNKVKNWKQKLLVLNKYSKDTPVLESIADKNKRLNIKQ